MKLLRLLLWIVGASTSFAGDAVMPVQREIGGVSYKILTVAPDAVRIVWKDRAGRALRTFPEAAAYLESEGLRPLVLMNGGIFEPGGVPSGLMVQDGIVMSPVNRRDGEGNFYLKPNGVFLVGPAGAAVISAVEYPPKGVDVRHAVQSGPLLLRRGNVHPKFNPDSQWRLHRNGVGVTKDGMVVLVMTDFHSPKFPTLHEFAHLFKFLGCEDALFLDGDISQMKWGEEIYKRSNRFGSMIAVVGEELAPEVQKDGGQ